MRRTRLCILVVLLIAGATPAGAADNNKELIVGKWDPGMGSVIEYKKDGTVTVTAGAAMVAGKYKFIDENTIEIELTIPDPKTGNKIVKTSKLKVAIKGNEMTTTDPEGRTAKLNRIK